MLGTVDNTQSLGVAAKLNRLAEITFICLNSLMDNR